MIANFCASLFFMYSILGHYMIFVDYISPKLTGSIGSFFKSFLSVVSNVLLAYGSLVDYILDHSIYKLSRFIAENFPGPILNLSGDAITMAYLAYRIKKFPNFKEIWIFSCKNIGDIIIKDLPVLAKLEKIFIDSSDISGANLVSIVKKADDLKKINVSWCNHLDDINTCDWPILTKLEYLDVRHSNIHGAVIATMIIKSPCLKKINASYCKNFTLVDKVNITNLVRKYHIKVDPILISHERNWIPNSESLSIFFENMQMQIEGHIIASDNPAYAFAKVLPIDIITLIIEFIPSDLFDAAKILQKQFPAQKNIIESFTASEKFKNLTVKYNNYSRDILQVLVDLPKRTLLNVDGINTAEKLRM